MAVEQREAPITFVQERTRRVDVAVIGAGPYGLSLGAHLEANGIRHVVLGRPMESWRKNMPAGMYLKSPWGVASSLSDPERANTLDRFVDERGGRPPGPIPIATFIDYALWFQRTSVPHLRNEIVTAVTRAADGSFEVELERGGVISARQVVVAAGIGYSTWLPDWAQGLPESRVRHSLHADDLEAYAGRRVAVVGAGQSGLETAALLSEAGADVELVIRERSVVWIHYAPWNRGLAKRVLYAPSDVGPAGLSWLIARSQLMRLVPHGLKRRIDRKAVHPAGARWLRDRVEGKVRMTLGAEIVDAADTASGLGLTLSDGSSRQVDDVVLAVGFRHRVANLGFLSSELREAITTREGMPVLSRSFETSVPGLFFAGAFCAGSFGPLFRFVAGADPAARRIVSTVASRQP